MAPRMSFSLSTYYAIWGAWALVAMAVVPYLLLRPAPYGRHGRAGWGPMVNARLAWVLMETPSPLGMLLLFLLGRGASDRVSLVFLGLWRPMPAAVVASGASFNLVNAYLNGCWLFFLAELRSLAWLASPRFIAGVAFFFAGLLVHVLADRQLRRLRAASQGEYVLPRGLLFRFVSCPNYLGEIVEWAGFALATWSPGGLIFAIWTAANLTPRAIHHHRWYRKRFPDYPHERRAMVPFVL
jgi:3-oxo-5-alpha-steroid 4-dehydrogenase 1